MPETLDAKILLEELRRWVEIETPTGAANSVSSLMRVTEQTCRNCGLTTRMVPGRDGFGDNLLVETPNAGDRPGILVLAHLDTVHPVGTLEQHLPFRVEGDKAFGPGIYDMKSGAFISVVAMRALRERGRVTRLPVRWVFASDEEVGSPSSRPLIEEQGARARYVLVVEPAREGGKCVTARKGTARYVMRWYGRSAHSGARPQDGRSAIREMAHQILRLEGLNDRARGVSVNVGIVRAGSAVNVVPEHACAEVDVRVPDMDAAGEVLPQIEATATRDPDVTMTVSGGLNRGPYLKTPGTAALLEHAQALAAEIGFDLQDTATGGGSDGNFLADRLPVLDGLGADGFGAHTHGEHIFISSLVPRARLLARLYETLE